MKNHIKSIQEIANISQKIEAITRFSLNRVGIKNNQEHIYHKIDNIKNTSLLFWVYIFAEKSQKITHDADNSNNRYNGTWDINSI